MAGEIATDLHTSTPTVRANFLVVDTNARDNLEPYVQAASDGNTKLLFPDIVMLEWFKGRWVDGERVQGDEWMRTVERWLEVIEPSIHACAVGCPVGQLIRSEIERDGNQLSLVSEKGTRRLFGLVEKWREQGTDVFEEIRSNVEETQKKADDLRFDHETNKSVTARAYEAIESVLTADEIEELRTSKASDSDKRQTRTRLMKRTDLRESFALGIAEFYGADIERVKYLLALPTTTFRYVASALSLALRDIQHGSNVSERNAPDVTNDIVDSDIATTASQAMGLLSSDERAKDTYSDLCHALDIDPAINPELDKLNSAV